MDEVKVAMVNLTATQARERQQRVDVAKEDVVAKAKEYERIKGIQYLQYESDWAMVEAERSLLYSVRELRAATFGLHPGTCGWCRLTYQFMGRAPKICPCERVSASKLD